MRRTSLPLKLLALLILLLLLLPSFLSAEEKNVYVPPQLSPWVEWVREKHPELDCAILANNPTCTWPGRLNMALNNNGGSFKFSVRVDRDHSAVPLPGDERAWPQQVQNSITNEDSIVVLNIDGQPHAKVSKGQYTISGNFTWDKLPEFITVPIESALIELTVNGESIRNPQLRNQGELWLQDKTEAPTEQSSVQLNVSRKLQDGVPFSITTVIELRVAGKPREVIIPNMLIADSTPVNLSSSLTARFDDQKRLVLQLKPGVHRVEIEALLAEPPTILTATNVSFPEWPQQEIWSWSTNELLRSVQVEGTAIDPQQTNIPYDWRSLPAYVMAKDSTIKFEQIRRGQKDFAPNQLNLTRQYWLDLDGKGFTIRDSFNGTMNQGWRLDALSDAYLGHISVNGIDQLITINSETNLPGVELRDQNLAIVAESRIEERPSELNAVGWATDLNYLNVSLTVPPGWSLFAVSGVDSVSYSWLSSWSLLDLFLLALVSIASGKLLGRRAGIVALVALVISHGQIDAPYEIWFHLLGCVALLKVLPENRFAKFVRFYFYFTTALLVLTLLPFCYYQIRNAIFPQLSTAYSPYSNYTNYSSLSSPQMTTTPAPALSKQDQLDRLAVIRRDNEGFEKSEMMMEEKDAADSYVTGGFSKEKAITRDRANSNLLNQVDPNAVVQTGPGVPQWTWRTFDLSWNGAVPKDLTFRPYLISPGVELVLSFLRVALFIFLTAAFIKVVTLQNQQVVSKFRRVFAFALFPFAVFTVLLFPGTALGDDFPSQQMLKELEQRLLQSRCVNNCTTVESLKISIEGQQLEINAVVNSEGSGAWGIPGPLEQFVPNSVAIDGSETSALRRNDPQYVWARVPSGSHNVTVKAQLINRDVLTLQFPQTPGHVRVSAPDWDIDGLTSTGSVGSSLQLSRKVKAAKLAATSEAATLETEGEGTDELLLPEWYSVTRSINIALPRTVFTTVARLGDSRRSALTKIKLLEGESVTDSEPKVEDGIATISFPRGVNQVSWQSTLSEDISQIALTAPSTTVDGSAVSETWLLACSSVFRCNVEGLPSTSTLLDGKQTITWNPFPDEKVAISIGRPVGAAGSATTIDSVKLAYTPGVRKLSAELTAQVRTTRGGFEKLTLSPGAEVSSLQIDGRNVDIRPENGVVNIPLNIGKQNITLSWQVPQEFSFFYKAPEVAFQSEVYNTTITFTIPAERWLLSVGGPKWGPVVLFWGQLVALIIAALVLSRIKTIPLTSLQWFLLGLGIASTSTEALLLPVIWFGAHALRKHNPAESWWKFNLGQVALVILSLTFFSALFAAIKTGLILRPDMLVAGNNSYSTYLQWYQDHGSGLLPQPWFISLPLTVYHFLMLLWACWLAFSLMKWLRWSWDCFSSEVLWKKKVKTVTPMAS